MIKVEEIRAMDDGDIVLQEEKLRKELFDLRCKAANESIDNPNQIQQIKRTIARLLTEQRRRELARSEKS